MLQFAPKPSRTAVCFKHALALPALLCTFVCEMQFSPPRESLACFFAGCMWAKKFQHLTRRGPELINQVMTYVKVALASEWLIVWMLNAWLQIADFLLLRSISSLSWHITWDDISDTCCLWGPWHIRCLLYRCPHLEVCPGESCNCQMRWGILKSSLLRCFWYRHAPERVAKCSRALEEGNSGWEWLRCVEMRFAPHRSSENSPRTEPCMTYMILHII